MVPPSQAWPPAAAVPRDAMYEAPMPPMGYHPEQGIRGVTDAAPPAYEAPEHHAHEKKKKSKKRRDGRGSSAEESDTSSASD
jgi:hypothetical protein